MEIKKALVSGITGQDGSYLAELLLEKGYEVHGIIRRSSNFNTERIEYIMYNERFHLHYGDVTDALFITKLIEFLKPDEIYNLAAQSHVAVSFDNPQYTTNVDALGTLNFVQAIKDYSPKSKFYQASTSELFGKVQETPQKETTEFYPRSPYAVAKLYAFWIVKNYREAYNIYACNGILFNHESERRGKTFVTRKITRGLCKIYHGYGSVLKLGNLDSKRDWGYAPEFVEGMYLMMQQDKPQDFVLATGKSYSIREFVNLSANRLGWDIEWVGEGTEEKGYDKKSRKLLIEIDTKYFRPSEVDILMGDASKAGVELGWVPKVDLEKLVEIMIDYDLIDTKKH